MAVLVGILIIGGIAYLCIRRSKLDAAEKEKKEELKAERKRQEEEEKLEKERLEKERKLEAIKKCVAEGHVWHPVPSHYKDNIFSIIDSDGHIKESCSRCGATQFGNRVVDFSVDIELKKDSNGKDIIECPIVYKYKDKLLDAGVYQLKIQSLTYLLANKNWPMLDISKNEAALELVAYDEAIVKTDDYPIGTTLKKDIFLLDSKGNIIETSGYSIDFTESEPELFFVFKLPKEHCTLKLLARFEEM